MRYQPKQIHCRPHTLDGLKKNELVALNSPLLHELYFASLGGGK